MISKKLMGLTLAALLSMTAFAGCGNKNDAENNSSGTKTNSGSDSKDESGSKEGMDAVQELVVPGDDYTTLDPQMSGSTPDWGAQRPVYEGLIRYVATEDGGTEVKPGVAKEWSISDDGLVYTFKLREDAKWADGTPLTANDFVYTYQRVFNPEVASPYAWLIQDVIVNGTKAVNGEVPLEEIGVKALDEYTLEITLEAPCAYFLGLTGFPTYAPVKKEVVDKYGEQYGTTADKVLGNGPFMFESADPKTGITYVKNPNYWNAEEVYLTKVTKKRMESEVLYNSLINKEVDMAGVTDVNWIEQFKQLPHLKPYENKNAGSSFLFFNGENEYLKNKKIRQALSVAFDRAGYAQDMQNGNGIELYSMSSPAVSIATSNGEVLFTDYAQGKNEYVKVLQEEIKDPKALFAEGLKELGKPEDPSQVTLKYMTRGTNDFCKNEAEWIRQMYKETLGINIEIQLTEWNIMWDQVDAGNYDIACGGWAADYNDPSTFLDIYHTETGYYNAKKTKWAGEEADKFNKLIDEAKTSSDLDKRADLYVEAEQVLIDSAIVTPTTDQANKGFRADYVKNWYSNPFVYRDYVGVYVQGK